MSTNRTNKANRRKNRGKVDPADQLVQLLGTEVKNLRAQREQLRLNFQAAISQIDATIAEKQRTLGLLTGEIDLSAALEALQPAERMAEPMPEPEPEPDEVVILEATDVDDSDLNGADPAGADDEAANE